MRWPWGKKTLGAGRLTLGKPKTQERQQLFTAVLEVRHEAVTWTPGDAAVLAQFMQTDTWKKIEAITHDSCVGNIVPWVGLLIADPQAAKEFVKGRLFQMMFLQQLCAPGKPVEEAASEQAEQTAPEETSIQFQR